MRPPPRERSNRSDRFAGTRVLASLGVSFATVAGVAAGPGDAPVVAVCAILGTGLVFAVLLFVLIRQLSTQPLDSEPGPSTDLEFERTRARLPAEAPDTPRQRPPHGTRRSSGPVSSDRDRWRA